MGDGRAKRGATEISPSQCWEQVHQVTKAELPQLLIGHAPYFVASLTADVHGDDGLPRRCQPRHGSCGFGESKEWDLPVWNPVHHVGEETPTGELHVHQHHRPVPEPS